MKYIKLSAVRERKRKTNVYEVLAVSDNTFLGIIQWYPPWRQYCFFPYTDFERGGLIFSSGCLQQIREFIGQLMVEQKAGLHGFWREEIEMEHIHRKDKDLEPMEG